MEVTIRYRSGSGRNQSGRLLRGTSPARDPDLVRCAALRVFAAVVMGRASLVHVRRESGPLAMILGTTNKCEYGNY